MSAILPKVKECPLRDEESKICMCQSMKCEDVDLRQCFGMRNAFQYGCSITEDIYLNELKGISEYIVKRVQELHKNEECVSDNE